ncbi:MerR family transcriptional regulator [Alkaliphilus transvaalensis]|uniref:MerR family transcriptional regulator n=1 Tax=Alkaliphilus transvaalensis TaxID=114628 RepID=UPI00047ACEDD|nr:MerR family transcriptional regulator [Alkaliphilus transvaalensis]
MKYSIGEFSDMLGVTADTLRLYEKHGIIKPTKNSKNYRFFNDLDARNLLISRWYRSIQIPLQDTAELTKVSSINGILDKMEGIQKNLAEVVRRKTLLLNKITEINQEIKAIEESINRCKIKEISGIYRLKQTDKNTLLKDPALRKIVTKWMDTLPFTFYCFRIEEVNDLFRYSWGLAILENEVLDHGIEVNDNVEYIQPNTYLSSVIFLSEKENITKESLDFMLDYIKEHQYSITGDIIGKIILPEKTDGENHYYIEVNIPISG